MQARLHGERTAVRLRDPLTDRESQSEATTLRQPRARPIGPPESLEDVRQVACRYPDARVANRKVDFAVTTLHRKLDGASSRRVLDRVRDQVQEQLTQSKAIAKD